MKIVVGLGNPGLKYRRTRHNLGYMVADAFAEQRGGKWRPGKFKGLESEVAVGKERVLLVKPTTFMNLSGECVGSVVRYYQVPLEEVLVVFDEVQLELGRLRLRPGGQRRRAQRRGIRHQAPGYRAVPALATGRGRRAGVDGHDVLRPRRLPPRRSKDRKGHDRARGAGHRDLGVLRYDRGHESLQRVVGRRGEEPKSREVETA